MIQRIGVRRHRTGVGLEHLGDALRTRVLRQIRRAPQPKEQSKLNIWPARFTLDCKACQAKLAAAQSDLTDERAKTTVLTRERNEAVQAVKGGSVLRRIAHNAKWLAIGAAAGAIAAKAHP